MNGAEESRVGRFCPSCSSREIRRSHHRNFLERITGRWLMREPYRCKICATRFFLPSVSTGGVVRVPISKGAFGFASAIPDETTLRTSWAQKHVLWIACAGVLVVAAAALIVEFSALQNPVSTSAPAHVPVSHGGLIIRRIPLPGETPANTKLAPSRKPAETSPRSGVQ